MNSARILGCLISLTCAAIAGEGGSSGAGNGGDVIVCEKDSPHDRAIELLDYYETRVIKQQPIQLPTGSMNAKISALLDRVKSISPHRELEYRSWLSSFFDEVEWTQDPLEDVPDSMHVILPKKCKIEQIAIQREPAPPTFKRYRINEDLWNRLLADDQAGLVAHELIYRELLGGTKPHPNSVVVREFNGNLASNWFFKQAPWDIRQYFISRNFPYLEVFGYKLDQLTDPIIEEHRPGPPYLISGYHPIKIAPLFPKTAELDGRSYPVERVYLYQKVGNYNRTDAFEVLNLAGFELAEPVRLRIFGKEYDAEKGAKVLIGHDFLENRRFGIERIRVDGVSVDGREHRDCLFRASGRIFCDTKNLVFKNF